MFAVGILVGLALFVATGLWYRQPNSRFGAQILGRDIESRRSAADFFRDAAEDTVRVLHAWRAPNIDPYLERDRQLMSRRYRILVGLVLVFVLFPLLFELIGLVSPVLIRAGVGGVALLALALAMLLHGSIGIARPVIAYGNGERLDRRTVTMSALRVAAIAAVLIAVVALDAA
jgi:hypothetical protein